MVSSVYRVPSVKLLRLWHQKTMGQYEKDPTIRTPGKLLRQVVSGYY